MLACVLVRVYACVCACVSSEEESNVNTSSFIVTAVGQLQGSKCTFERQEMR